MSQCKCTLKRNYVDLVEDAGQWTQDCHALTLREASYFPARNSDLKEWGNFAKSLEAGGYFPIVIRDAEKITEETPKELDGITQFPEAVFNMGSE